MPMHVGVGVAAVIINNQDKLLMIQRKGAHGAGTWSVPGGWIEHGEWAQDAAIRETYEEVGIEVLPIFTLGHTEDIHPEGIHDICLWVLMESEWDGIPSIMEPDKVAAIEWWTLEEVKVRESELFLPLQKFLQSGELDVCFAHMSDKLDGAPTY